MSPAATKAARVVLSRGGGPCRADMRLFCNEVAQLGDRSIAILAARDRPHQASGLVKEQNGGGVVHAVAAALERHFLAEDLMVLHHGVHLLRLAGDADDAV